jgi:hypothetical protein
MINERNDPYGCSWDREQELISEARQEAHDDECDGCPECTPGEALRGRSKAMEHGDLLKWTKDAFEEAFGKKEPK